jgi:hypothetical protein
MGGNEDSKYVKGGGTRGENGHKKSRNASNEETRERQAVRYNVAQ